ncbi:MAG: hypothetical protein QME51_00730 [Planctomycetota bacterium]|nr:hypothetical protein [Planctomycetota bacterium]
MSFTRCPKCDGLTRIRKFCLLIHVEPKTMFSLNKSCKYCSLCDLIITKQTEIEQNLAFICEHKSLDIIGNKHLVLGTIDRKDWKIGKTCKLSPPEAIECFYPFKDVLRFRVEPAGWYHATNKDE